MSDSPSEHQKSVSFSVTQRLLEFLSVLRGQSITLETIKAINKGELDILSGLVVSRAYGANGDTLEQVTIQTKVGDFFTLSGNLQFLIDQSIIDAFKDDYLFNTPREIGIINLNTFEKHFQAAANYGQDITSIYNRVTGKISILTVHSRPRSQSIENASKINKSPEKEEKSVFQPYPIEVRFLGNFSAKQREAFDLAAKRWGQVIWNNLPTVRVRGEDISGVLIDAVVTNIDGPGNTLGQSLPIHLRPGSLLPATGMMQFDISDLESMEVDGTLVNIIAHEMGHVLGFGSLWERKGLLRNSGTDSPTFIGVNAMREYAKLINSDTPTPVPVENSGGKGTRDGHWRDAIFGNELMSSFLGEALNPISRMTIAAFQDIGYTVNPNAADAFILPSRSLLTMIGITEQDRHHFRCTRCNFEKSRKAIILPDMNKILKDNFP